MTGQKLWRVLLTVGVLSVALAAFAVDSDETLLEQSIARAAEENTQPRLGKRIVFNYPDSPLVDNPLFVGVDDVTVPAYQGDAAGAWVQAFLGWEVYGAAYDVDNDRVFFNNGAILYEWQVSSGVVTELGTITDPAGATQTMVGLAFYDGTLYSVRNIANEAVYIIDTTTLVATPFIDYVDGDFDFGGLAADPNTGELYGTNDDSTPNGNGLFRINLDGTATLITPYPAGETDIDGLAVGDNGLAYFVTDQPGDVYVWDLAGGVFLTPFPNPWTTSEVFSGGAWITDAVVPGPAISLTKTVGTVDGVCATTSNISVAAGTTVYYCYEVTNIGDVTLNLHDLVDDQLGTILSGFSFALDPGVTINTVDAGLTISAVINSTTTNTGTWTAYNAGPVDVATDVASATVTVEAPAPSIVLTKTVGTVPGVCATTDTITVATGTEVHYCYVIENTGNVTLEFHDLVDSELGVILDNFPYTLPPGGFSPEVIVPYTVMAPVTNTATWTATDSLGGYTVNDTIAFNYEDISATGTAFTLPDDGVFQIPIGFNFDFYGSLYTNFWISSNGFMSDADYGSGCCTGDPLPDTATPNGTIAGWWEDLDAAEPGAELYYETLGTTPNQYLVVTFQNVQHYPSGNPVTMQYKLFEDGTIEVHYQDAPGDGTGTHSAGIENQDGTVGIQYYLGLGPLPTPLAVQYAPAAANSASSQDTATVNLEDPDIDVTPPSLTSSLLIGNTETQVLTIANTGSATLDWNLDEAPPNAAFAFPPMAYLAGPGDVTVAAERFGEVGPVKAEEDHGLPIPMWDRPQQVLFDNGPLVTHPGGGAGGADASALQTALGMGTYGFGHQLSAGNRVADDFTIAGANWTIETITFFAYQTGSSTTSTITGVNLQIWDGPPDNPGSTVVWGNPTTNIMTSTTWSNAYRVLDTTLTDTARPIMANTVTVNATLPPGTYWLDWQSDGTLTSGPWAPPVSILGQTTTGNAKQFTTTGWADLVDVGPQGLPFIIEGTSSNCYTPADIPWLSASPTSGSTPGAGSANVDVVFDATATPVGTYDALLCVFSNDPDEPLVEVPVQMQVVIPVELMEISIE